MRPEARTDFLIRAGWGAAERKFLAGDASARSYERVALGGERAVLMDAPPGCGDDVGDFLRIGAHLAALGLSPPKTIFADESQGFLLIEDLGDDLFARLIEADPAREKPLLQAAADVLLTLQAAPPPEGLPDLSAKDWAASALFAPDFYAFAATGERPDSAAFLGALTEALERHADGPRVLILRDYHAENLLWLPERQGVARVGLLDYQLGQMGQPEYDLVSLLQDARRDVSAETEAEVMAAFARARGISPEAMAPAYATLGALRALRILGIFARLCLFAGKDRYLAFLPRVWGQLQRNLSHPDLARLRTESLAILPAPTPETIERIRSQCGKHASP